VSTARKNGVAIHVSEGVTMRFSIAKLLQLAILPLAAIPAQAVDFPIHANDLNPGERIVTDVHATGGGPQTGAKDLIVLRRVANDNWPNLESGKTDKAVNDNYLIYGRPFFAMASGTVVGCWRNAPENTPPGKRPEIGTKKILLQGNHLWIKQADGNIALYAHAIPGSIPTSLCPHNAQFLTGTALNGPTPNQPEAIVTNGVSVLAGQMLGKIGNSGNSTEPHLHMHMVDASNNWQPMKFDRGQTTAFAGSTGSLNGPWTALKGSALPMSRILVWPPHPVGNWTYNGIEGPAFQRVFDHFVDSGMMPDTITCKNNGATYDSTWIPTFGSWITHHNMTVADHAVKNATYVAQGFKRTSVYTCGTRMVAIWRK
jgi:hypothetical protein